MRSPRSAGASPMMAFDSGFEFDAPSGRVSFLDLFEGLRQLVLYHFWFPEDGEPCGGCTMFADQVTHLAHLHARDVSFALVSRASQERIAAYKERMGWDDPVVHGRRSRSRSTCGTTEYFRSRSSCATATTPTSPTRPRGAE